jgi:hypothetical protein
MDEICIEENHVSCFWPFLLLINFFILRHAHLKTDLMKRKIFEFNKCMKHCQPSSSWQSRESAICENSIHGWYHELLGGVISMTHNCLFASDIFLLRALHKAIKRSRSMHTIIQIEWWNLSFVRERERGKSRKTVEWACTNHNFVYC